MSTCNFTKVNASRFYVLEDCNDYTAEDIREAAQSRDDAGRFSTRDDWEERSCCCRDRGLVVLEYDMPEFELSGGECLKVTGEIIIRPGYYAGATLDWNFRVRLYAPDWVDDWNLADWDGVDMMDEIAAVVSEIRGGGGEEGAARDVSEALVEAGGTLDGICADLCDERLSCVGVFSNGEAIYQRV